MLAYHNDPSIKDKYVNRMKSHVEADDLIQGTGWDGYKGCAVGCTFEDYDHARGPIEIGVPKTLLWLEDAIFEGLSWVEARKFPLAFLEAIPVGADLSTVWPRFALWMLSDPNHGAMRHCNDDTRPAIEAVANLYRRRINGEQPADEEFKEAAWEAAWAAAWAAAAAAGAAKAAAWAAGAAVWAAKAAAKAAAWAAKAAAKAAAWAAKAAARTARAARAARAAEAAARVVWAAEAAAEAARAAARAAAEEGFWIAARDELLRLLRETPVAEETGL